MSDTIFYSSVCYEENEYAQERDMSQQLAADLEEFISNINTAPDKLRLCIYGSGKSGVTVYNALGLIKKQDLVSYFVDQQSRGLSSGIIRDPDELAFDWSIGAVIVAVHPRHYSSILKRLKGKKIFLAYLPDFRSDNVGFTDIECPGNPVVLCSHAYDGHVNRIFMELLGSFHYDYRCSFSSRSVVFSHLKNFSYVHGHFSHEQFSQTMERYPKAKFIYYYRNIKDLLYFRYHSEKADSPEIHNIEEREDLIASLKIHFDGYTAPNGKYVKSMAEEMMEQRKWIEDTRCFHLNHDAMDESNIVPVLSEAMAFAGIDCARSHIEKAVKSSNHIVGKSCFSVNKNVWVNLFDHELNHSFELICRQEKNECHQAN